MKQDNLFNLDTLGQHSPDWAEKQRGKAPSEASPEITPETTETQPEVPAKGKAKTTLPTRTIRAEVPPDEAKEAE